MLVLQRRAYEEISINNGQIILTVLEIGGRHVKLGWSAPRDVLIMRREIEFLNRQQEEKSKNA